MFVPIIGIEPMYEVYEASALPLSYIGKKARAVICFKVCCGGWVRTSNLQVMGLARYHFSTPRL